MKKVLLSVTAAASIFAVSACSNASGDNSEVIVETSEGNVTQEEFYNKMKERVGEATLQELVTDKVLSAKYEVSDKEVDKRLEEIKANYGQQFQMLLAQSGFKDEEQFKEVVRSNMLREKAAMESVDVSEEELKKQYEQMKPEIKASHILVKDEKTAKEVKQKLDNGGDFAKLAEEYSTGPSGPKGGDLGYFSKGDMVPEFEEAAYKLKVDEVSAPVKSQFGWHIIKVTDKKELKPFEEMKDEVKKEIVQQKLDNQKIQEAVQKELDKANIKVKDEDFKGIFDKKAQEQQQGGQSEGGEQQQPQGDSQEQPETNSEQKESE
ncbi:peptidylprolyl isomerase [Bacillus tianshenii]|nr:peptidylprolyl isomerase [Bacillus tianshenii]